MKKIILLLVCFISLSASSQSITKTDMVVINDVLTLAPKKYFISDGANNQVEVRILFGLLGKMTTITADGLNNMLLTVNGKSLDKVKFPSTYKPTTFMVYFNESTSEWNVMMEYSTKNAVGVLTNGTSFTKFDINGNINSFKIY